MRGCPVEQVDCLLSARFFVLIIIVFVSVVVAVVEVAFFLFGLKLSRLSR